MIKACVNTNNEKQSNPYQNMAHPVLCGEQIRTAYPAAALSTFLMGGKEHSIYWWVWKQKRQIRTTKWDGKKFTTSNKKKLNIREHKTFRTRLCQWLCNKWKAFCKRQEELRGPWVCKMQYSKSAVVLVVKMYYLYNYFVLWWLLLHTWGDSVWIWHQSCICRVRWHLMLLVNTQVVLTALSLCSIHIVRL